MHCQIFTFPTMVDLFGLPLVWNEALVIIALKYIAHIKAPLSANNMKTLYQDHLNKFSLMWMSPSNGGYTVPI